MVSLALIHKLSCPKASCSSGMAAFILKYKDDEQEGLAWSDGFRVSRRTYVQSRVEAGDLLILYVANRSGSRCGLQPGTFAGLAYLAHALFEGDLPDTVILRFATFFQFPVAFDRVRHGYNLETGEMRRSDRSRDQRAMRGIEDPALRRILNLSKAVAEISDHSEAAQLPGLKEDGTGGLSLPDMPAEERRLRFHGALSRDARNRPAILELDQRTCVFTGWKPLHDCVAGLLHVMHLFGVGEKGPDHARNMILACSIFNHLWDHFGFTLSDDHRLIWQAFRAWTASRPWCILTATHISSARIISCRIPAFLPGTGLPLNNSGDHEIASWASPYVLPHRHVFSVVKSSNGCKSRVDTPGAGL